MRYWWLTLGLLRAGLLLAQGDADIPFGSWRVHVPYADCKHLAETPERILAAS